MRGRGNTRLNCICGLPSAMKGCVCIMSIRSSLATACDPRRRYFCRPSPGATPAHLGRDAGDGLGWTGREFDREVLGLLLRIVPGQRRGRRLRAGDEDRLGEQLRRGSFRVEIAQHPVHARLGKRDVVAKRPVVPRGVIVHEELQIAADNEGMKELFVNNREFLDPTVLPRVEDREGEANALVRFRGLRRHRQVHVIFGQSVPRRPKPCHNGDTCQDRSIGCPDPWDRRRPDRWKDLAPRQFVPAAAADRPRASNRRACTPDRADNGHNDHQANEAHRSIVVPHRQDWCGRWGGLDCEQQAIRR